MPEFVRRTGGPDEARDMWTAILSLWARGNSPGATPTITATGAGNGRLRVTVAVTPRIDYVDGSGTIAIGADQWTLTGVAPVAGRFRAHWLYSDEAGTVSVVAASSDGGSAADALRLLPTPADALSIVGVFVLAPGNDPTGDLESQVGNVIHNGIPDGAFIGVIGADGYRAPKAYDIARA